MTPDWLNAPIPAPAEARLGEALARQGQLTKPPGSLGRLEELAVTLAALQDRAQPKVDKVRIVVFAGDHGICAAGVSAFPQAVTVEMIKNFARGGAAICIMARELGADLEVVDVGAVADPGPLSGVISRRAGAGTADFRTGAAMEVTEFIEALDAGREAVGRAEDAGAALFIGGDMGIGNTSAATALFCAYLDLSPEAVAGPGTGLDAAGVGRKAEAVRTALRFHAPKGAEPLDILRRLGGFEIAALAGAFISAAEMGMPVLVDGFIATAAALAACRIRPEVKARLLFSHRSAEPGHALALEAMEAEPLLDLGMRLGEGSGAAAAVPLLRLACSLHNGMATFAEAGVSGKEG